MLLDPLRALKHIKSLQGLCLLHGDEPLMAQLLLDGLRQHWREQGIERQRLDLNSPSDWHQALAAADSLSLFSTRTAVEAHGSAKPDADLLDDLQRHADMARAEHTSAEPASTLVVVMPAFDKAAQKSKFFQWMQKNATVVALQLKAPADRRTLLEQLAQSRRLPLSGEQWTLLLEHSQNNLLAAQQTLLRLEALHDPAHARIDDDTFAGALVEQSRHSPFDLAQAALEGRAVQAVQVLRFLQESGEAPSLVLWALNRDMKLLMQLMAQPDQAQALGIWASRLHVYQQALRRLRPAHLRHWPTLLLRTDTAIKGASREQPWDLLLQCTLALAGVPIFLA